MRIRERVEGYEQLEDILCAAYDQAAVGKGKERHANNQPFHEQRMQGISDLLNSDDGMAYQVMKKLTEGLQMEPAACERELLGVIVYTAGIILRRRRLAVARASMEPVINPERPSGAAPR